MNSLHDVVQRTFYFRLDRCLELTADRFQSRNRSEFDRGRLTRHVRILIQRKRMPRFFEHRADRQRHFVTNLRPRRGKRDFKTNHSFILLCRFAVSDLRDDGDRVLVIVDFRGRFGGRRWSSLRRGFRFRQRSGEFSVSDGNAFTIAAEFGRTAVHSVEFPRDDRTSIGGSLKRGTPRHAAEILLNRLIQVFFEHGLGLMIGLPLRFASCQ